MSVVCKCSPTRRRAARHSIDNAERPVLDKSAIDAIEQTANSLTLMASLLDRDTPRASPQLSCDTEESLFPMPPLSSPSRVHVQRHSDRSNENASASNLRKNDQDRPGQPSQSYAFPPRTSYGVSPHTSPKRSNMCLSTTRSSPSSSSRRSSSIIHEIQSPARSLSNHQILLLTPFGGTVPQNALGQSVAESSSMARTSTAMAPAMSFGRSRYGASENPLSSHRPTLLPHGNPRPAYNAQSPGVARPRFRPHSYSSGTGSHTGPSPLGSAPMSTIFSASSTSESSEGGSASLSRDTSSNSQVSENERSSAMGKMPSLVGGMSGAVAMTRSNSVPVLTLRALEALKQKDGELGIVKGGMWAWITREESGEEDASDAEHTTDVESSSTDVPELSGSVTSTGETPVSATPTSERDLMFSDPFARPMAPIATSSYTSKMSRDAPLSAASTVSFAASQASSTMDGYEYSPNLHGDRRMSEAPVSGTSTSPTRVKDARRPSVPVNPAQYGTTLPRSPITGKAVETKGSPPQTSRSGSSSPRPPITRYRSLPGRHTGMGFSMILKEATQISGSSSGSSPDSPSTRRESTISNISSYHTTPRAGGRRRSRLSGTWAQVDVLETLTAPASPPVTNRALAEPSNTSPRNLDLPLHSAAYQVERVRSRAGSMSPETQLRQMSIASSPRKRFDSLDAGTAIKTGLGKGKGLQVTVGSLSDNDWGFAFPRRGSLAVLTSSPLAAWAKPAEGQSNVGEDVGQAHWTDRRGSWAEGWRLAQESKRRSE